jgi:hypothetical protein
MLTSLKKTPQVKAVRVGRAVGELTVAACIALSGTAFASPASAHAAHGQAALHHATSDRAEGTPIIPAPLVKALPELEKKFKEESEHHHKRHHECECVCKCECEHHHHHKKHEKREHHEHHEQHMVVGK